MVEVQVDALVGPTHHFGGLGVGNVASQTHAFHVSHPRQAALEGLDKAAYVASLGIPQYLLPPPMRPRIDWLAELGFIGSELEQLRAAQAKSPVVLSAIFSSAFMWAANSSTVTPSSDSCDGRLHLTTANLISSWHRSFEAKEREVVFKLLLGSLENCSVHSALPSIVPLRDEGAANHMRLADESGRLAIHIFVHGDQEGKSAVAPSKYFARHTYEASQALARQHQLDPRNTFFLQQHPAALDAGVFHNDVIAMSNRNLLVHHELAFSCEPAELDQIGQRFKEITHGPLNRIVISEADLPLQDAVSSYLFNSQVLTQPTTSNPKIDSPMLLVCPQQCRDITTAMRVIDGLIADPKVPIADVHFAPLTESMAGGGGPACLRLRMPLEPREIQQLNPAFAATPERIAALKEAISQYYPAQLVLEDFVDVDFIGTVKQANRKVLECFLA